MSTKYMHGVWRPGTGAQFWKTKLTFAQLKQADEDFVKKGLRMVDLVHENGDGYTALWRAGSGKVRWVAGVSSATEFKAFDAQFFKEGLRISAASRRSKYCGIWRPGSGAQKWRSGMTVEEFKTEDAAQFKKGMRLATVELYTTGSSQRVFAYWRPGSGAQYWMAGSGIAGADQAYFNTGYRIKARSHGSGIGLFVWTKGTGAQWWTHKTVSAFKTFDKQKFDEGLRLTYLSLGFGF
jgi:hypothetical protein